MNAECGGPIGEVSRWEWAGVSYTEAGVSQSEADFFQNEAGAYDSEAGMIVSDFELSAPPIPMGKHFETTFCQF